MSLAIVLALALSAGSAAEPALCKGVKSEIEPDMQIAESDLDRGAAIAAASQLQGMVDRGELSGEFYFGALNQIKIIKGHMLLQQAQSDRTEHGPDSPKASDSTKALCQWLSQEGFWYD